MLSEYLIAPHSAFRNYLLHLLFLVGGQLQMLNHVRIVNRRVRHGGMNGKAQAKYGKEHGYESHRYCPRISGSGKLGALDAQIDIIHDSIWTGAAGKPLRL